MHVHVEKERMQATFWLIPQVTVAYIDGYDARTLRELLGVIEANRDLIERAWHEFFG